jgi:hypothetical protein
MREPEGCDINDGWGNAATNSFLPSTYIGIFDIFDYHTTVLQLPTYFEMPARVRIPLSMRRCIASLTLYPPQHAASS